MAELLIALAILGIIAMFTVPKILSSQADSKRKAVFRETFSAINDIMYSGYISGELVTSGGNNLFSDYLDSRLNYLQHCTQSLTQGCYTGAACIEAPSGGPGYRLHNGSSTCGMANQTATGFDNFWIDWNGPDQGANTEGDDQLRVRICIASGCPNGQRPGTVIPFPGSALSESLYNDIFER